MDYLHVVANAFRMHLVGLGDWLFGCSHRRTTFPWTLRASVRVGSQQSTRLETYIVCLECGRHFAYDWTTMRIRKQRASGTAAKNDVTRGERLLSKAVSPGFQRDAEASRGPR